MESFWCHTVYSRRLRLERHTSLDREDTLLRYRLYTLVLIALLSAACDRVGEIVIVPEFDFAYSFENDLEGWYGSGVDLGTPAVEWSMTRSSEHSSLGSASAALTLDNASGAAKVWLEREFDVQPERAYDIQLSFDLGTSDHSGTEPWRVLAGAHTTPPTEAADLAIQDPTSSGAGSGVTFVQKNYTLRATADEEGHIYLVVGVWGTSLGARGYFVDNVHVFFTRVSPSS